MQPPRIPSMKKVDSCEKHREFIPDELHHIICPKYDDSIVGQIRNHHRGTANKRLERIKMMKGEKCVFDDDDGMSGSSDDEVVGDATDAIGNS